MALVATSAVACATVTWDTNHLVRIEYRDVIVPESPEMFTHDADGNLTADGLWTYTWDGENRLIGMESQAAVPAAFKKRLAFAYDHQSRRTRKVVYSSDLGSPISDLRFLNDGWNVIRETVAVGNGSMQSVATNDYTWGLKPITFGVVPRLARSCSGMI